MAGVAVARAWRLGREEGAHCQRGNDRAPSREGEGDTVCVVEKMRDGKVRVPARE